MFNTVRGADRGALGGNVRHMECSGPTSVVFDPTLTEYNFGPTHPMSPVRVDLTMRLAEELGVLAGIKRVDAPVATDEQIATVHEQGLIDAVTKAGATPGFEDASRGLGTDDDPVFKDMHLASAHVVGASLEAFRQVWSGESLHSVNIAGGLHHAMPDRASGFCIYNDVAVGITQLLADGAERVAYVDIDVHHGDGVEKIFWDDPRVLTISLHETGQMLFPGTGFPTDSGGPGAEGTAVNVALPPGTSDAGWLRAFHAVVPPVLREFRPAGAGHPARLRLPHERPARPHDAEHRRPAGGLPRAPRARARGRRRTLGRHGRRWLLDRRRRAACLGAPARDRGGQPARPRDRDAARLEGVRRGGAGGDRAAPDDRRAHARPSATGRRATTPRRGWTGRSTPRAPRCSRSTGSTRCPERSRPHGRSIGKESTRHAASPTSFFGVPLPHASREPYSHRERHACDAGAEAGAVAAKKDRCTPWLRTPLATCPRRSS